MPIIAFNLRDINLVLSSFAMWGRIQWDMAQLFCDKNLVCHIHNVIQPFATFQDDFNESGIYYNLMEIESY